MQHRATLEDMLWLESLPPEIKERLARILRTLLRSKLSEHDIHSLTK